MMQLRLKLLLVAFLGCRTVRASEVTQHDSGWRNEAGSMRVSSVPPHRSLQESMYFQKPPATPSPLLYARGTSAGSALLSTPSDPDTSAASVWRLLAPNPRIAPNPRLPPNPPASLDGNVGIMNSIRTHALEASNKLGRGIGQVGDFVGRGIKAGGRAAGSATRTVLDSGRAVAAGVGDATGSALGSATQVTTASMQGLRTFWQALAGAIGGAVNRRGAFGSTASLAGGGRPNGFFTRGSLLGGGRMFQ